MSDDLVPIRQSQLDRIMRAVENVESFPTTRPDIEFVRINGDFELGKYPVTQREYEAVMGNNPSRFSGHDLPVESVSYDDAVEFCEKLGGGVRLPTEAEWQLACGHEPDDIDDHAWYCGNSDNRTHPVGEKLPNDNDIYDMLGNVWEWTSTPEGDFRVLRGGAWYNGAVNCGCSSRSLNLPSNRDLDVGFRLARTYT